MSDRPVLYDLTEGVATITLNRPDKLNAWTRQMEQDVRAAMAKADGDPQVRVVILTGAGRGFCAGADMSLLQAVTGGETIAEAEATVGEPREIWPEARSDFQQQLSYFPAVGKPVIAAINGPAAGLGMVLPLYCDLRFASDQATFLTAFSRRGLIAEYGISWLLSRLVGPANAMDLLFSSRKLGAAEAEKMGLVNRVIPHEQLMEQTRSYALDLARNVSPRSMRVMKRQVYGDLLGSLESSLATAAEEMFKSFASKDFQEGVAHYIEKRPPRFTGE